MSVPNPSLPVPKKPQAFVVPLRVSVDSDAGDVTVARLQAFLKDPLLEVLSDHIFDRFDRDSGMPADFAFHGAKPEWASAYEVTPSELDNQIERVLQDKEQAVLDQDFARAAELRQEGEVLIARRNRIAAMGLPPLLRTALKAALVYAKAFPEEMKRLAGDGAIGPEHYKMLQERFGFPT